MRQVNIIPRRGYFSGKGENDENLYFSKGCPGDEEVKVFLTEKEAVDALKKGVVTWYDNAVDFDDAVSEVLNSGECNSADDHYVRDWDNDNVWWISEAEI